MLFHLCVLFIYFFFPGVQELFRERFGTSVSTIRSGLFSQRAASAIIGYDVQLVCIVRFEEPNVQLSSVNDDQ